MRTGPAFNRRVVVGGFGEQGLTTVPHGYRINVYLRVEHNAIFVKNGAAPPILSELISANAWLVACLLYTSPSPRDRQKSRMPSSA